MWMGGSEWVDRVSERVGESMGLGVSAAVGVTVVQGVASASHLIGIPSHAGLRPPRTR